ncbi:MAG: Spx/MgsR family RNA polymerase-binding regulatory protein [Myxococcales bacterium]|nr:Spx/MgsR family RNA polymerase-binding regulatory protein [Myxococcales bacterium]
MTTIRIYTYDACSTCRKAVKWLNDRGVAFDTIPIVDAPPTPSELAWIQRTAHIETRKLFNTSGRSYREGGWKDKISNISDAEAFEALAAEGKLIKRPLLVGDNFAIVGFSEETYTKVLGLFEEN